MNQRAVFRRERGRDLLSYRMPPRTLASLAHALGVAPDLDAALVALGEALAEADRGARLLYVTYDARRALLGERRLVVGDRVTRGQLDTAIAHLPTKDRAGIEAGVQFVDFGERGDEFARLFDLVPFEEPGFLSARGLRFDNQLAAVLVVYESRKLFGTRASERLAPSLALFELALGRLMERDARGEAVSTLEHVTRRVHDDYDRKLSDLEARLLQATGEFTATADRERELALEREAAQAREAARRAERRAEAVEATVTSAVSELEKAHVELHRRSETLRQKTRTLYLIERVLTLDAGTDDPRALVDGLLALVGDDLHAERCSLLLRAPEEGQLYLAAGRGLAPGVNEGARVTIGQGVSGRVAESREALLVTDAAEASDHPLLKDQYFTTGSFISFPLVHHDELIGVVNVTNRARQAVFVEDDMERVRLLGLVIALVASRARLAERLFGTMHVG
ncbi:MAG: hypothetical protein JWO05_3172 [Gemmatimonadetes bacterium]|nr:hypothetical protein [Gemmatimonadota bacterium]